MMRMPLHAFKIMIFGMWKWTTRYSKHDKGKIGHNDSRLLMVEWSGYQRKRVGVLQH